VHAQPTKWNWIVLYPEGLELGYGVDIGAFTLINAKAGVAIGDYVQIGSHCAIHSVCTITGRSGRIVLEKKCKIGSHSIIMPGVTVGEEAVVGAGSYLDKDVEPGAIIHPVLERFKRFKR